MNGPAFLIAVAGFAVLFFFIRALVRVLSLCSPENRAMAPDMAWLLIVPLFGFYWQFRVVASIAKSLDSEFKKRGITEEAEPGKKLGITMCILALLGMIPILGIPFALATLVCVFLYWSKIAAFSERLALQTQTVAADVGSEILKPVLASAEEHPPALRSEVHPGAECDQGLSIQAYCRASDTGENAIVRQPEADSSPLVEPKAKRPMRMVTDAPNVTLPFKCPGCSKDYVYEIEYFRLKDHDPIHRGNLVFRCVACQRQVAFFVSQR